MDDPFTRLVRAEHAQLVRAVYRTAGAEAEDIVQETWAWLALKRASPSRFLALVVARALAAQGAAQATTRRRRVAEWGDSGWASASRTPGVNGAPRRAARCIRVGCTAAPHARKLCQHHYNEERGRAATRRVFRAP